MGIRLIDYFSDIWGDNMKDNFELRKKEHEAVRHNVGYYDFTHQLLNVTGSDSAKFLDRMFVNNIKGLKL